MWSWFMIVVGCYLQNRRDIWSSYKMFQKWNIWHFKNFGLIFAEFHSNLGKHVLWGMHNFPRPRLGYKSSKRQQSNSKQNLASGRWCTMPISRIVEKTIPCHSHALNHLTLEWRMQARPGMEGEIPLRSLEGLGGFHIWRPPSREEGGPQKADK